jgi:hypothetical protein
MSQSINIVKLIEENPNTKLSKSYQGKLINKLKESFSTDEQQLFISSFYCYLNYKSDDFVIDLDDVWSWLGFTRKDSAKKCLEKYFKVDIDFKLVFRQLAENLSGGRPSEKILLNIKTFKKMCLKANTSKANEIHEYYIKLEETLHEIINEESNELRLQLEAKETIIEETKEELTKLTKKYVKPPKEIIKDKNVVYLMTTEESEKSGEYVIGKATDLNNRKEDYNHNKLHDFKVVYHISLENSKLMDIVEAAVLMKLGKYRCKAGRDVFLLPEPDISLFTMVIEECAKFYENVQEDHVVYAKRTYTNEDTKKWNNNRKEVIESYSEEKKEELKEKEREYKIKNEEAFSELRKIEHEENREEHNKMCREYYEKNKEDVKKQANEYYSNNKSFILDESKKRYQENKEEIKELCPISLICN